jgi:membrane protein DedA with SNARE-associated domain
LDTFAQYGYVGIFVAILATGCGLPVPEELPVLTAGVLVGHGDTLPPGATELDPTRLRWFIMLPVCIVAVVLGDGILYGIGRYFGPQLLSRPWVERRLLPPDKRAKIEKNFRDRGVLILLTARLTPGIRGPIFMMAGVLRVPLARFVLADAIYAVPGVGVLFWLAYFAADQVMEAYHRAEQYKPLFVFGMLSAWIGIILYRVVTSRQVSTGAPEDVPIYNKPVEKVTEAAEHAVELALKKTAAVTMGVMSHLSHPDKPAEAKPPEPPEPPAAAPG